MIYSNMSKFIYCPKCSHKGKSTKDMFKCLGCGFVHYFHSCDTGSIFLVEENKVLLAKRNENPQIGKWDAIGGFLNYGEHPKDGTIREVKEETNLEVRDLEILGIYMDKYEFKGETLPTLNTIYIGKIAGGKLAVMDDVAEVKWFDIQRPIPNIAFPAVKQALKDLRVWYNLKHK